jgi:hypothetical protein
MLGTMFFTSLTLPLRAWIWWLARPMTAAGEPPTNTSPNGL